MNGKAIKLLEFDAIRIKVAELSMSEEAAKLIIKDEPKTDAPEVNKLKKLVASAMERMTFLGGEKRESLPEIENVLNKLNVEGMVLEADEVYALLIFLDRAETLRQWFLKAFRSPLESGSPHEDPLAVYSRELPDCTNVKREISKIIDMEGKLRDLGELRDIRRRIKNLQKEIESSGARYAGSEETRRMLQSELPSQRDGRLVLAVKANFRGRIKGIVHEISSSGQTVFIEPEEVVEMNNELLVERRLLDAEIRRILRELSARIAANSGELNAFHRGIMFIETIRARARYGYENKWVMAPDFSNDASAGSWNLVLKKARHPLLGNRAVPLDLFMEHGIRTVIITGPNTGGKTIALKTLGLLALMNQFGLALPVGEGTFLPVFDGVYADIGDEQSLSQSLSTFSAHMTNIAGIIASSTEQSLVLLDELGSGTDPEEGSAIAMAILDHFIGKKATLVVTTHHGILKNYGYTREGVENASMEFDSRTLSPTFRIVMGIPGESRAMDIALRNGFPAALVQAAIGYLDSERADVSALIAGLRDKHRELDAAAEEGKKEEKRLLEERRRVDLKELRLKQKEIQLRSDGIGKLSSLLSESRKTLENLVREIKEAGLDREKTLEVKAFLSDLEAKVNAESDSFERERQALALEQRRLEDVGLGGAAINGLNTISPGRLVLAGTSRRPGRVLRLAKKGTSGNPSTWIVEVGSLKMSFAESELVPAGEDSPRLSKSPSWAAELAPSSPLSMELRLRGMRLNDALAALEKQIEAAVLGGLNGFSVIHGKGDGILSRGVHDFLKKDPRVADYFFSRPEVGGFGRTEVVLK